MHKTNFLALLLCVFAILLHSTSLGAADKSNTTLKVGDPAPELKPTGWLNGGPINKLEKGTVYVIECWATWCGPCIAAIPHVSELNTKYKGQKVEFIGLNVWERDQKAVKPMVNKKLKKIMNYPVALDADGKNADNWLKAAGQSGIPCSFVVNRDGVIAWIGHPNKLGDILESVVAGTYDVEAIVAEKKKKEELNSRFGDLLDKADTEALRALIKETIADDKEMGGRYQGSAIAYLYKKKSYDAANALADDLNDCEDTYVLAKVADAIINSKDMPDYDKKIGFAVNLAEKANAIEEKSSEGENRDGILSILARGYYAQGDKEKALNAIKKAIKMTDDERAKQYFQRIKDSFK